MDWKKSTREQQERHLQSEQRRRKERKAAMTDEQRQKLSQQRKAARERRKERDLAHHQTIAKQYKRSGRGYFYSWANQIRRRARERNLPCDIDAAWLEANLPTHCPVLGEPLVRRSTRDVDATWSPTVDRLIPALGYIRENSHIISRRANNIKSDASAAEIRRVAEWVETTTLKR